MQPTITMDQYDEPPGTVWERYRYGFETGGWVREAVEAALSNQQQKEGIM